eukprot:TRINITY_DN44255_c0_g1_i1.p1 TRINITY_DN44255_c0_g1~~TRINITY_DN44255_c0_g1_i1.p1  ORF type:complete len:354 (+),score=61.17 TRINITY_DN44255_c0_g1_i1:69-1130(+)
MSHSKNGHPPESAANGSATKAAANGTQGQAASWLDRWRGVLDCLGSVGCSVSLILVNKHIFTGLQFRFVLLTTTMHFVGTYAAMTVFMKLGWFEARSPPGLWDTLRVSGWSVGSIVMMNLSLTQNSVGFYQMMKIVIIPVMLAVNIVRTGKSSVDAASAAALTVLLAGLGLATVSDVSLTLYGASLGIAAVVCTVGFQLGIQHTTQAYGLTATQLQYDIALPQAAMTLLLAIPSECVPPTQLASALGARPIELPLWVLLSVFLAMGVNYYCFAVIGRFSAITYQVVNHAKTVLVLVFGLLLFPTQMAGAELTKHIMGLGVAVAGVIAYSLAQASAKKDKAAPASNGTDAKKVS